jgi:hypothetical protein
MTSIADRRLRNQGIAKSLQRTPEEVVAWFGAVQAQEYLPAKWALGLRLPAGATSASIEQAFEQGRILRTHVMRPTWHFVTPRDIRWMLELTAPRVRQTMASYTKKLGLDAAVQARAASLIERALAGGQPLTRQELGSRLARGGLPASGVSLALLTMYAELEGVICSGPMRGRQITYALLAERAPDARRLARDEALAELTTRFIRSHGPATLRDFVWWSGLRTPDARRGLEIIRARSETANGFTYWTLGRTTPTSPAPGRGAHLLPIYDEYLVPYRDRDAVPHGPAKISSSTATVTFQHAVVVGGQVAGTWRTSPVASPAVVSVFPVRRLAAGDRRAITDAAVRYEGFLGEPVRLVMATR